MTDEASAKVPGRTVTSKVLDILAAFEVSTPSLSLTQIAERADLPLPTAHRLVGELVAWGALTRQTNGNYSIGIRLWAVGENSLRAARGTARMHLQDLFATTQETAQLAVRAGNDALYVDRVYSSRRVPRSSRVGGRIPLHLTSVGKVLLANETPEFTEQYLAGPLAQKTPFSHTNPRRLAQELQEVQERGYATSLEELRLGSCSIAVPVVPQRGLMPASVGIVLNSGKVDQMVGHLPAIREVALRMGRLSTL